MMPSRRIVIALWVAGLLIAGWVIMRTTFGTDLCAQSVMSIGEFSHGCVPRPVAPPEYVPA